jgi:hypothetical protein
MSRVTITSTTTSCKDVSKEKEEVTEMEEVRGDGPIANHDGPVETDKMASVKYEHMETEVVPVVRKKWWQVWKKNEEGKAVPIYKLFRYATWFDWLLIITGLLCAIIHGAALPGAMFVFGDLTNLFFNHNISRQIFEMIDSNYTDVYSSFTFDEFGIATTIPQALLTRTITPSLVATQEDLTDLNLALLSLRNDSSNVTIEEIRNISCVNVTPLLLKF